MVSLIFMVLASPVYQNRSFDWAKSSLRFCFDLRKKLDFDFVIKIVTALEKVIVKGDILLRGVVIGCSVLMPLPQSVALRIKHSSLSGMAIAMPELWLPSNP